MYITYGNGRVRLSRKIVPHLQLSNLDGNYSVLKDKFLDISVMKTFLRER